ncbi:hypothetical protein PIB30_055149 [Stylosanthes scabra]|uniref:Uncharacterized protein n=1 Tax=Stylosanthes scabra TaxID=79078 RepID=A0ABU6RJA4_9FABA|nr:hypothetical protein [Stylosanthes scabra]
MTSVHLRRLATVDFSRLKSYASVKSFRWSSFCHPAISRSPPFAFCSPPTAVLREKVVPGRVWDPSVELVMSGRGEVGEHEVKTGITKEILDEWKIVEVEQCPTYVTSKERDPLADLTMLKYNEVDEDWVRCVHLEEVVNE